MASAVRTSGPTTRSVHALSHFIETDFYAAVPGLVFPGGCDPAYPLIACQWRNACPYIPDNCVRLDRFAKICRYSVHRTGGDRLSSHGSRSLQIADRSANGCCRQQGSWSSALQAGELAVGPRRILLGQDRILFQQLLELRGEEGGTEIKPLVLIATELGQQLQLLGRLHALRNHLQGQTMRERDDRAHDRGVLPERSHLLDEAAIDLELVDRKAAQIAHARVAGAEVIDR